MSAMCLFGLHVDSQPARGYADARGAFQDEKRGAMAGICIWRVMFILTHRHFVVVFAMR